MLYTQVVRLYVLLLETSSLRVAYTSACYIGNINKLEAVKRMYTKRLNGMCGII